MGQTPDITSAELQTLLSALGLDVGIGTLWRFFKGWQISFAHAAEQERADMAAARKDWFAA